MKKFNIKKGDTVYVNAGNDKGKNGKVLEVLRDKDRVLVEGINLVSKHTKPNPQQPQGGIVKKEAPIHISNVNLMDESLFYGLISIPEGYGRTTNVLIVRRLGGNNIRP